MDSVKGLINSSFKGKEPWQIVTITTTSVLGTIWIWNFFHQDESVYVRGKKIFLRIMKCIPSVRRQVEEGLNHFNDVFEKEALTRVQSVKFITSIPQHGLNNDEVMKLIEDYVQICQFNWKDGKVSGTVYRHDEKLIELMGNVYGLTSYTNPLHCDIFPGICKMEAEVVRIACGLFHGDDASCGTMTTGGTESIFLACKAYRDYAREIKGIKHPEMLIPVTAHSAFDKAGQFLNIKLRLISLNPDSYTVNIKAMKRAITSNTIMLVGSAPNFPYGTIDDIEAISELGFKYNIPVHVDACLGGFLLCFMPEVGYNVSPFDFTLRGVTSISADTHKYGYTPKGSSVILYREKKYRHHQYTVSSDWPGGIYGSPTVNGSRAGGVIATCWAAMMHIGYDGYLTSTKKIIETTKYLESELRKMDGIFIFGTPGTSVIALGSHQFDIYRLSEGLITKGWNLNALQFPSAIHLCVTHVHTQSGVSDSFLQDVRDILDTIKENSDSPVNGTLAMYGMSQRLPDRTFVTELTKLYIDSIYFTPKKEEN